VVRPSRRSSVDRTLTTSNGLLLVDKPQGLTSHDVVARVRRILHEKKVGHAGTLDPMATGLLVLAVGPSTRLLRFAQSETKRYSRCREVRRRDRLTGRRRRRR
jgi:tRNA pseudouridine(55) synthase